MCLSSDRFGWLADGWGKGVRAIMFSLILKKGEIGRIKAVFSEENYVSPTIHLSLELICEMR